MNREASSQASDPTMTTRREFLRAVPAALLAGSVSVPRAFCDETSPQSVRELWADFDPRREPLEIEILREWKADGGVFRHVRYLVGKFKGRPARMTAIYGFPDGAKNKLPAVMHIHGGGQRGSLNEVKFLVARGYAALSVNWGGSGTGKPPMNSVENAEPGDPNTDWGAVDPTQLNVPGYSTMQPGPKQFFEDREHPKNNNWYLLTVGCRRGLTFLERQPEVDAERLGVHGYSMGGNLTMYVSGVDDRVKAAVPAVGGQGWRWEPHEFSDVKARLQMEINGDVDWFRRTLSFESYAPLIRCPVLHRSATNDFHGWMDDVYRTNALIANQPTRYSWTPHMNHRLTPEVEVAMPLWFDHYLKGGPPLPETPGSKLSLGPIPKLRVVPAKSLWQITRAEIFYSTDPDPRARFWRSGVVVGEEDIFAAELPLHTADAPLFAFANVYYRLPEPVSLAQIPGHREPVRELCLSSLLHTVRADELKSSNVLLTAKPSKLIDDFSLGLRDWCELNAGNPTHRQLWTRKITDPLWRGSSGTKLRLTLNMPQTNHLSFVLQQNEWRDYRGARRTFVCSREIEGADESQSLLFEPRDFIAAEGPAESWAEIDQLGICANFSPRGAAGASVPLWNGPAPQFLRLEWI
jgi:dienelactone hydrolase